MSKQLLVSSLLSASLLSLATPTLAEGGFTVTPSIGQLNFGSDRELEDETFHSLGLGYRFSNPVQLELVYMKADPENEAGTTTLDYSSFRLDTLYHFSEGDVQPYLSAGIGHVDFDGDLSGFSTIGDGDENTINLGAGIKFKFSDQVALRPEIRGFLKNEETDARLTDIAISVGLQFLFGKVNDSTPVEPVTEPAEELVDGDADGDGVTDSNDLCPGTPSGVEVDSQGCALDSDGDGVADYKDDCPDSEAGAKVDEYGCYIVLEETVEIELEVNFATNLDVISSEDYSEIRDLADFMTEYPETEVVIEGHTDSRGDAGYNQSLSEKRAAAVAKVLVSEMGIDASRVSSVGYGEERPIADNMYEDGRAQNRRVVGVVSAIVKTRAE